MKSGGATQALHGKLCEERPRSGADLLERKACEVRNTRELDRPLWLR